MGSVTTSKIPKIDFSGLDVNSSGSCKWEAAKLKMMEAIDSHGFFRAAFDEKVTQKQLDELIGQPLEDMFRVPMENKLKIVTDKHYESYIVSPPLPFEILIIKDPTQLESIQDFANKLWPQGGNPSFCNKVWSICKQLGEMELIFRKMILEALHAEKHYESHVESTRQTVRFARYETMADDQEAMMNMAEHTDMNTLSIVYQHEEEGLEVQTHGGEWIKAPKNSFTVIIGETLMAMTNGRLKPTLHRVNKASNGIRYSLGFSSHTRDGYKIQVLDEFVDEEHPNLFKPYEYFPYMQFRVTEAGMKAKCALTAYCGVAADDVAA